jgi:LmbE family N-acetylglucosaminyl deacetylase
LCESYGDGGEVATIKSGFQEVAKKKKLFGSAGERLAAEREAEAIAAAHDLSVREILDLTFGDRKPYICMQSSTGGW